jgi:hypothetical protein
VADSYSPQINHHERQHDLTFLLSDLERLSEAGRDRFLKLLPVEDVIEAFKAALRKGDETRRTRGKEV